LNTFGVGQVKRNALNAAELDGGDMAQQRRNVGRALTAKAPGLFMYPSSLDAVCFD
jgi:hypothetical protein